MFRSTLHVAHISNKRWELTHPLVWEGKWQYIIVRSGFETDFASIPKPIRWLLDNAGGNAEAAVLHDAVWRESKRERPRIDPWHADGIFRKALRETGSTALSRALMWFAVRAVATVSRRFGKKGPPLLIKVLQLLAILVLGIITALVPTIVAALGLLVFWIASWVVAVIWWPFENLRLGEPTNWPWPSKGRSELRRPPDRELLLIVNKFIGGEQSEDADDRTGRPRESTAAADALEQLLKGREKDLAEGDLDGLEELAEEQIKV
jgi:Protein of unknown function (DUF1353)